jgi:hypothetical protein
MTDYLAGGKNLLTLSGVRFLPAGLCCASGNLSALLRHQLVCTGFAALLAAEPAQLDGSGIFAVWLALGQFSVTYGHVDNELRELVNISGAFAFWHTSSMPYPA